MIPDEAFKEASDTYMEVLTVLRLSEGGGFKVVSQQRRAMRAALEAAAPHLMAQAWDEGANFVDEHIEVPYGGDYLNPYRKAD